MTSNGIRDHEALINEISGVLNSIDELPEYLERVVHAVRHYVAGCDEVGITLSIHEMPRTAAYTTVDTLQIDADQYAVDEGPCLTAVSESRVVVANFDDLADQWPNFAETARSEGIRSVVAVPLISGNETLGALNLYSRRPDALEESSVEYARLAATRAADAIAALLALHGANTLVGQLENALASRAGIEQAKGVLMALRGFTEGEAFDWLREQSQTSNVKLRDVAARVLQDVRGSADSAQA